MADYDDYAWLIDHGLPWLARVADDCRPALQLQTALRRELPAERAALVVAQAELRRKGREKFGGAAARMLFAPTLLAQATDLAIAQYKAARLRQRHGGGLVHDYCCGLGGDLAALAVGGAATGWDRDATACLLARFNAGVLSDALRDEWAVRRKREGEAPAEPNAVQAQDECDGSPQRAGLAGASPSRSLSDFGSSDFAVRQADVVEATPPADVAWHADPDRRASGRRATAWDLLEPPPEAIARWLAACAAGAVKLAPATELPSELAATAESEWISSRRECRQQMAWFGPLATAPGRRRATRVTSNVASAETAAGEDAAARSEFSTVASFVGDPSAGCDFVDAAGRFVYDPDPAVVAAGLTAALAASHGMATLGAGGVYLTHERLVHEPLLAAFEVEAELPLQAAAVARWLAERGIGQVEVKTRGVSVDPQQFRRRLKLRGGRAATLLLTRIGRRELALVAQRVAGN